MSGMAQFPFFSRLPTELRALIWQQIALPKEPLIHILDHLTHTVDQFKVTTYPRITFTQMRDIAAVMRVSREARHEVLKRRQLVCYAPALSFAVYFDDGPHGLQYESHFSTFFVGWETDMIYLTNIPKHLSLLEMYSLRPLLWCVSNLALDVKECGSRYLWERCREIDIENVSRHLLLHTNLKLDLPNLRQLIYVLPKEWAALGFFRAISTAAINTNPWTSIDWGHLERAPEAQKKWGFFQLEEDWVKSAQRYPLYGSVYIRLSNPMRLILESIWDTVEERKKADIAVITVVDHLGIESSFGEGWRHWAGEGNPMKDLPLQVSCLEENSSHR